MPLFRLPLLMNHNTIILFKCLKNYFDKVIWIELKLRLDKKSLNLGYIYFTLYYYPYSTDFRFYAVLTSGGTFLPVRPAHSKWHTGLLYAVRPSFGPSKDAGAVCPYRNVCRPYFSNCLRRPSYLLVQLRPTPSAERLTRLVRRRSTAHPFLLYRLALFYHLLPFIRESVLCRHPALWKSYFPQSKPLVTRCQTAIAVETGNLPLLCQSVFHVSGLS